MKFTKYIGFLLATTGILSACSNSQPFSGGGLLTNEEEAVLNEFYTEQAKKTELKIISGVVEGANEEGLTTDEAFGINGELLLPFDQAFPYYMQNTKYDANSLLVKAERKDIFSIYRALNLNGVSGYEEVIKVDSNTSWYKLFLKDITSNKAINLFRSINTKAQIFDLNYVIDHSSATLDSNAINLNSSQKSNDTTIDNCGIDGASKNEYFKDQWYFKEIGLKETYKEIKKEGLVEGGEGTVVAVIDTGVDIKHEDLRNNIWTNSLEIPNNGIDDDNNGYVDDVNGWNFVDSNNDPDDDQGHGTHVAGIIGAENNDVGVVGVAYKSKIMPLKAGDGAGYFTQDRIAEAIVYAYMNGADVINMSFGGSTCSLAVQDALESAYTTSVLVSSAGNEGRSNEILPSFPAAFNFVLGVMSINSEKKESNFTNIDAVAFDLSEYEVYAPGENIYSTIPNDCYLRLSGTSMAAPIVSGIVSLLKANRSDSSMYPSKYFMGQICASSNSRPNCTHLLPHYVPCIVNSYTALTKTPAPSVIVYDYYIFDSKDISSLNNNDGSLDAGETVYIAPVLLNRWGKAANVILSIDSKSSISGEESKYVTLENNIINFGDIGTYSFKEYLIYESNTEIAVSADFDKCLKIKVENDVPNKITIPLNFKTTSNNGMNLLDTDIYESDLITFNVRINRGVNLPKIIKEDMTLTNDKLWVVNELVQVSEEVTLTIEAGTELIFGSAESSQIFGGQKNSPKLVVYGTLLAIGTPSNIITITCEEVKNNNSISISGGYVELEFCNISGPTELFADVLKHCKIDIMYSAVSILEDGFEDYHIHSNLQCKYIENSKVNFYKIQDGYSISTGIGITESKNSVFVFSNSGSDGFSISITLEKFINSTIVTKGQGPIYILFRLNPVDNAVVGEFIDGEKIWNSSKINLLTIRTKTQQEEQIIEGGVVTAFQFAVTTAKKLYEEKNIRINCPYNEHLTDKCKCSFPNNTYVPFLYNKKFVYFLDGTKVETNAFIEFLKEDPNNIGIPYEINVPEDQFENGLLRWSNNSFYDDYFIWADFYNGSSISLLYGHRGGIDKSANIFNAEELNCAKIAHNFYAREAALRGWGSGGALLSENINILASNLTSQIKVDVEEDKLFDSYKYDNLFNFNTSNEDVIDYLINDGNDSLYKPCVGTTDESHEDNSSLWPYVTKLELLNSKGEKTSTFSNEELNVVIHFNREMDMEVPVSVKFGSYGIYADYEITGEFVDSKTWEGTYVLNTLIESGTQYFNISGGAALTDAFMDIEEASGRFSFVIDTAKTLSKNIFAASTEEGILLSWNQDDYGIDTIMGFNIYRSDNENGHYTKINKTIVSKDECEYLDKDVIPGEEYWYTFTVVLSDLTESSPAGKISVTAIDTMSPNIYHNPVYEAYTGSKLTISCLISDNIGIDSAYLYYRKAGEATYKRVLMNSSNNRFTASISSSELSTDGLEYYIEASDGTNIVSKGTADNPYFVLIRNSSSINTIGDVDGDGSVTVKDAYLILQHIYGEILLEGDAFARADLNKDGILSTVEAYRILQYVNGNITTLNF